jgi:hypothetical protein
VTHNLADFAAAEFFRTRMGEARPEDLHTILALVPQHAPDPDDEVAPGL